MKVAIVVLILVAVLFAVALGLGFRKEPSKGSLKEDFKKGKAPGWTDSFKGGGGMPGIKLKKERLTVPGDDEFLIEASDEPFRMLKLAHDGGGKVAVEFKSKEAPPKMGSGDELEDPQKFKLAKDKDYDAREFQETSVVVFKSGGTLKLSAVPPPGGGAAQKGFVKVRRRPMPPPGRASGF